MFPVLVYVVGNSVEDALCAAFVGKEVHRSGSSTDFPKTSFQDIGSAPNTQLWGNRLLPWVNLLETGLLYYHDSIDFPNSSSHLPGQKPLLC